MAQRIKLYIVCKGQKISLLLILGEKKESADLVLGWVLMTRLAFFGQMFFQFYQTLSFYQ